MIVDIFDSTNKYDVILADPQWKQKRGGYKASRPNSSGKELDYPVLSLDNIKEHLQKADELTANNSVIFIWTIDKYLFQSQEICEQLGYKLHARMIWNKVTGIPAAFTIRFGHEYLLWMYKGKLLPIATEERGKIHSVFTEKVTRHSKKPEISYQIIERLYPNAKKLEMYARYPREGWDCWGNEV